MGNCVALAQQVPENPVIVRSDKSEKERKMTKSDSSKAEKEEALTSLSKDPTSVIQDSETRESKDEKKMHPEGPAQPAGKPTAAKRKPNTPKKKRVAEKDRSESKKSTSPVPKKANRSATPVLKNRSGKSPAASSIKATRKRKKQSSKRDNVSGTSSPLPSRKKRDGKATPLPASSSPKKPSQKQGPPSSPISIIDETLQSFIGDPPSSKPEESEVNSSHIQLPSNLSRNSKTLPQSSKVSKAESRSMHAAISTGRVVTDIPPSKEPPGEPKLWTPPNLPPYLLAALNKPTQKNMAGSIPEEPEEELMNKIGQKLMSKIKVPTAKHGKIESDPALRPKSITPTALKSCVDVQEKTERPWTPANLPPYLLAAIGVPVPEGEKNPAQPSAKLMSKLEKKLMSKMEHKLNRSVTTPLKSSTTNQPDSTTFHVGSRGSICQRATSTGGDLSESAVAPQQSDNNVAVPQLNNSTGQRRRSSTLLQLGENGALEVLGEAMSDSDEEDSGILRKRGGIFAKRSSIKKQKQLSEKDQQTQEHAHGRRPSLLSRITPKRPSSVKDDKRMGSEMNRMEEKANVASTEHHIEKEKSSAKKETKVVFPENTARRVSLTNAPLENNDDQPKMIFQQPIAARNRTNYTPMDVKAAMKKADASKWKIETFNFDGEFDCRKFGKWEHVEGKRIDKGIKKFKSNPEKYIALVYQRSMRFAHNPKKNVYTLIHREGTKPITPKDVDAKGKMTLMLQHYQHLKAMPKNELPLEHRDDISYDLEFNGVKLPKPLLPGRGMGIGDAPNLKIIGDIDPSDIAQGDIGNCWMLSAISALAEFDGAIKKIFRKTSNLDYMPGDKPNMYTICLYDVTTWTEVDVVIDESLSAHPYRKGETLGAQISEDGELWVSYLEKAFIKHCGGGWDCLDGGHASHAWSILTGCKEQYFIRKNYRTGKYHCSGKYDMFAGEWKQLTNRPRHEDMAGLEAAPWPEVGGGGDKFLEITKDELFMKMYAWDVENYIVGASSKGTVEDDKAAGMVRNHAYSVIDAYHNVSGTDIDLFKIRNPWGHGESEDGLFSDTGSGWDQYPQIKAELNPVVADDGIFYLTKDEFFEFFDHVYLSACNMTEFKED